MQEVGKAQKGIKTELIELLEYFHSSTEEIAEKASSDIVKKIDKMLMPIKNSPKFGGDFMSYEEKIYTEKKESETIGMQKGLQLGRQEGRQEEKRRTVEKCVKWE